MTQLSANQMTKLGKIVAATQDEATGFLHMSTKSVQILLDAGLVECNTEMTDAQGNPAVRATQQGIETMNAPDTAPAAEAPASAFKIDTGIPVPTIRRAGSATSKYPFDDLPVGGSFFVPATEEMPNPGKSLASTVSSASKRYATKNGTRTINRKADEALAQERGVEVGTLVPVEVDAYDYERKFIVRSVEENGVSGARVWRIDPNEDDGDADE